MYKRIITNILNHRRQCTRVLAFVLFLTSAGVLLWSFANTRQSEQTEVEFITPNPVEVPEPETPLHTASASPPVLLHIDRLNLSAPFEGVMGLAEDGSVEVPEGYDTLGWYGYGPTPGELGPAVILGHVDSVDGPGVFFSLGQVQEGDTVEIERADGSILTFTITGFERVEQDIFPTDRVYGSIPYAGIRLITCSGVYDKGELRYSHNLIVYGMLTDITHPLDENENSDAL